jgi:hypothetical protein
LFLLFEIRLGSQSFNLLSKFGLLNFVLLAFGGSDVLLPLHSFAENGFIVSSGSRSLGLFGVRGRAAALAYAVGFGPDGLGMARHCVFFFSRSPPGQGVVGQKGGAVPYVLDESAPGALFAAYDTTPHFSRDGLPEFCPSILLRAQKALFPRIFLRCCFTYVNAIFESILTLNHLLHNISALFLKELMPSLQHLHFVIVVVNAKEADPSFYRRCDFIKAEL